MVYTGNEKEGIPSDSSIVLALDEYEAVRLIDDSELVAYMHYVLVDPAYHGRGIASTMVSMVKEKYKNYLYIEIMPEQKCKMDI